MGKKKQKGNSQKDRKRREEKRRQKRERRKQERRKMSVILGPDGKTPVQSDAPVLSYQGGGLRFTTPMIPDALLTKALAGAQQMIGGQVYAAAMKKHGSPTIAQNEGNTAAAGVQDPFTLEPCAMAVFMYMSREIEYRDMIIEQVNERLVSLGAEPIDMTHPYPVPDEPEAPEPTEEELASEFVPGAEAPEEEETEESDD